MFTAFFKYFFTYLFRTKTRQRLLLLALVGLVLSAMALLILQSIMGGLQYNLISRSKAVSGTGVIYLANQDTDTNSSSSNLTNSYQEKASITALVNFLRANDYQVFPEFEMELLVRHQNYISPAIVHGIDPDFGLPTFLISNDENGNGNDNKSRSHFKKINSTFEGAIVGNELSVKLQSDPTSQITLISPSHTNQMLGDIPRQVSTFVTDTYESNVPEIDALHLWVRSSLVNNLTHLRIFNRIRIYSPFNSKKLKEQLSEYFHKLQILQPKETKTKPDTEIMAKQITIKSWVEENDALVWAMNLENSVMVFLFVAMTFLVGISITSGFLIFFDKIQLDLVSFWMLGCSRTQLERAASLLVHLVSIFAATFGLVLGAIILLLLDRYAPNIMPDIFVEQKLPVHITATGVIISFIVPYFMALGFASISLRNFKRDDRSFTAQIRSTNH